VDFWLLSKLGVLAYLLLRWVALRFDSVRLIGSAISLSLGVGESTLRDLSCDSLRGRIRILLRLISRISRDVNANNLN
jgi:hypothetical protein